ncbi:hypothetical protein B0H19DRAFT_1262019 [Mycena capillaripes]|nr:hypothetical protein B0H19DRAFT_1262019 [Mycena capillaripes]
MPTFDGTGPTSPDSPPHPRCSLPSSPHILIPTRSATPPPLLSLSSLVLFPLSLARSLPSLRILKMPKYQSDNTHFNRRQELLARQDPHKFLRAPRPDRRVSYVDVAWALGLPLYQLPTEIDVSFAYVDDEDACAEEADEDEFSMDLSLIRWLYVYISDHLAV